MNPVYVLSRSVQTKRTIFEAYRNKLFQKICWSSSNSSSSDDEKIVKVTTNQEKKKEAALNKLNDLLKSMIEEDTVAAKTNLVLSQPVNRRKKHKEEVDSVKVESVDKQITRAVKNVAETLGGDIKQTESELLEKLLNTRETKTEDNLNELVKGMKFIREDDAPAEHSRAEQVKQILQYAQQGKTSDDKQDMQKLQPRVIKSVSTIPVEKLDLFGSEPLGIFTDSLHEATEGVENKAWRQLYERDLKLAVTHPPRNYFQQMILWTEQGKVWKFPIDNEQGLEEEKSVYFTEHVFLEKHLEPWCPQKGPIRHFMELVCVGLSKNPYLTVEMKKEHIEWFRQYFEDKKQLLKELGAIQNIESLEANSPKRIEE